MKHLILILLVLPLCISCEHSLNVANGMLTHSYKNDQFNGIDFAKVSERVDRKGEIRKSSWSLDTSDDEQISDQRVILINQILTEAPGVFSRDYLRTLPAEDLRRIFGVLLRKE
jgi:hypothetical protein